MKAFASFAVSIGVLVLPGCVPAGLQSQKPQLAPPHQVINAVKDELAFFSAYMAQHPVKVPASRTGCNTDEAKVSATPVGAKLTLKTVATGEDDPAAGLASPIGVIAFDPSFAGAYSVSNAQTIAFDFDLTKSPGGIFALGEEQARREHPITVAVHDAVHELALIDHEKRPCLAGPDLTVTVNFDVVNKTTVGAGVTLVVVKAGYKRVTTDEAHQTLEFRLKVSGPPLFQPG